MENKLNQLFSKLSGLPMNTSLYYRIKDMFGKENDSIGRMLLSYITSNDIDVEFKDDLRYFNDNYNLMGMFHWVFDFNVNGIPIHIVRDLDVVDDSDVNYSFIIPLFGRDSLMVSDSLMNMIVSKLRNIALHQINKMVLPSNNILDNG
jgi:hypothetical protein